MSNEAATHPIAVLGGGPAGMATALALRAAGHDTVIYERYPEARPAGNILNLWPPPIKALREMGVDIDDLGAPCHTTFRNARGRVRADVQLPADVVEEYGGGFIGLLRPDLYRRMLEAIPAGMLHTGKEVVSIDDHGDGVTLKFKDGSSAETSVLIGADGIDSQVRKHLWGGPERRPHNLQILGGFLFETKADVEWDEVVLSHGRKVQGAYTTIRSQGRTGLQWWVLEAWPDDKPGPADLHAHALKLAEGFLAPLPQLVRETAPENVQRWQIRDVEPMKQWSKGRITLAGDAAHATSPYAAYGAGMSICDGYYLGQLLAGVELADTAAVSNALLRYEQVRIPHTTSQVAQAFMLGKIFHHLPAPLRPLRDLMLDRTPFLQKQIGERSPGEIIAQLDEMGEGILSPAPGLRG